MAWHWFWQKKKEEQPKRLLNILLYMPQRGNDDLTYKNMVSGLEKLGHITGVSEPERYYENIKDKEIILFIMPRNVSGDALKQMIIKAREYNPHSKILVQEKQECMRGFLEIGIDYFIMTDVVPGLSNMYVVFSDKIKGDWTEVGFTTTIIEKIRDGTQLDQNEHDLVVEKAEFYNGVADIFTQRSTQTADINQELSFITGKLRQHNCQRVLDAGCGNGRLTRPLAACGFTMTGVDVSDKLLKKAKSDAQDSGNPQYMLADILHTPFRAGSFNAVLLMWHVICELKNHQQDMFREAYRVLDKNGILIFDFPDVASNAHIRPDGVYECKHGLNRYRGLVPVNIDWMFDTLEKKGFEVIEYHRVNWGIAKMVIVAKKI